MRVRAPIVTRQALEQDTDRRTWRVVKGGGERAKDGFGLVQNRENAAWSGERPRACCEFLTRFNKIGVAWKPWGRGVARDG
jgi:hypothetical protein